MTKISEDQNSGSEKESVSLDSNDESLEELEKDETPKGLPYISKLEQELYQRKQGGSTSMDFLVSSR